MSRAEHPGPDHQQQTALLLKLVGDVTAMATRITSDEARIERLADALDELEATLRDATDAEADDPAAKNPPGEDANGAGEDRAVDPRRLVPWVRDNVAMLLQRKVPQTGGYPHWCRQWWRHPEAIARFEAVYRAWEEAAGGPGGAMVVYFERLDAMLDVLCAENGPFSGCVGGRHSAESRAQFLGHAEPDERYFAEYDAATASASTS